VKIRLGQLKKIIVEALMVETDGYSGQITVEVEYRQDWYDPEDMADSIGSKVEIRHVGNSYAFTGSPYMVDGELDGFYHDDQASIVPALMGATGDAASLQIVQDMIDEAVAEGVDTPSASIGPGDTAWQFPESDHSQWSGYSTGFQVAALRNPQRFRMVGPNEKNPSRNDLLASLGLPPNTP